MAVYSLQLKQAQKSIKKQGQLVTWNKLSNGTFADPNKPWLPGASVPEEYQVFIAFLPLSTKTISRLKNTEIPQGAFEGLLAGGLSFDPEITDTILRGAETLRILDIDKIEPNDEGPILFTLVLLQ